MKSEIFKKLIQQHYPHLSAPTLDSIIQYRELVLVANHEQNLTRLTTPEDFFYGHLVDCFELNASGIQLKGNNLDLGSGCGVPGLLYKIMFGGHWVLTDSEIAKANFLKQAIIQLKQSNITAEYGRAEKMIDQQKTDTVVSRAVGKIAKIYPMISKCSTWNRIILFKGPGWNDEWADFTRSNKRNPLEVTTLYSYQVNNQVDVKSRIIVELTRK
jgi:16S rRNA (guanine527-N7)-methyltransferase